MTQLTVNSAVTEVTEVSSFFANYGFEPETLKEPRKFAEIVQKAIIQIEQLQLLHKELQKDIQFFNKRSALYVNKRKDRDPTLKEGNKVYLLRRNIKTKRSSNKLDHIKLESFRILEAKESINFKLNLSALMRIRSIFHIFLLKSAHPDAPIQTKSSGIDPESQNVEYEVEDILNQQEIQSQPHYLIK